MKKIRYRSLSYSTDILFYESVTAASAVVLIASAIVLIAASVIACKNEDKDDEENPVAVATVAEEHLVCPLSYLPLHIM